ncbi:MAG: LysR family transcriptional regulator [Pirellulaceae bacterium]|nr:LysR family transcriptional regulator [Pirellulaceae bacterium]
MKPLHYKYNRLQQLRGFCYAARTGSITRAAEQLMLSQPSVSLQIKALERELKTKLFERHGSKITLTPEGKILWEQSWPLVEGIETLPGRFAARCAGLESGRLDIAAGESTILYILPKYIEKFMRAYPGIEVKLHNVTGRDGMTMLRNGEAEVIVGSMIDVPHDIDYRPSLSFDPMLIVSLDHPLAKKKHVSMKDIAKHPFILPPRRLTTWRVIELVFQQHQLTFEVSLEAGGWEIIKKYVGLGLGISIVTSICLTGAEPLAVIPMREFFPQRTYGVVLRKGQRLSPAAQRFVELFKQTDADRPAR